MSKNCKDCDVPLHKALFVESILEGSVSEKILKEGDAVIALDENAIKKKSDLKKAEEQSKFCKITILHSDRRITTSALIPVSYLNDIDFSEGKVCVKCGEKHKGNVLPFVIGLILLLLIAFGVAFAVVYDSRNKNSQPIVDNSTEEPAEKANDVENEDVQKDMYSPLIISQEQIDKIENDIKERRRQLNDVREGPRFEWITEKDMGDSEFYKELHEKLEKRYNELFGNESEDEGDPFGGNTGGLLNDEKKIEPEDEGDPFGGNTGGSPNDEKGVNSGGIGENKTKSDKPPLDRIIRIYFDYGSYLYTKREFSIGDYLEGTKIQFSEPNDLERVEVSLALCNFINSIPAEKLNKAVFAVVGYTDTSYINGKSDKGSESKKFNTDLSCKRADNVNGILVSEIYKNHISKDRILSPEGRGFEDLICKNGEEDHEKSRRVEVFCYAK